MKKLTLKNHIIALIALLCLVCVALVGCSVTVLGADGKDGENGINGTDGKDGINGVDGKDGAKWYCGVEYPLLEAQDGDFYVDTDDYTLYQMQEGSWTVVMQNFGKPGANGKDGINGTDGKDGLDGLNGTNGTDGKDGVDGANGKDGSCVYIGYDGYVWQDDYKTDFKLNKDDKGLEDVVEDTIGAYTTMKYFKGSFVDLSSKQIALMANYKQGANVTQYSGTTVSQIQLVSENAGELYIGSANVKDVVMARLNGKISTSNVKAYSVNEGVNTIELALSVGEKETIIIGGNNSTAKIYAVSIPNDDEQGNFSLIDGKSNQEVLSKTKGYADTIAIRVRAESYMMIENEKATWDEHLDILTEKERDAVVKEQILKQALKGKRLSVLGDSISTFIGVSNNAQENLSDNAVHYISQMSLTDTYWQQVIDAYGMELCVNNSWSGAYASMHRPNVNADKDSDGSLSSGIARANKLAKSDGTTPDYILVFIGINDFNAGVAADIIATSYTQMLTTMTSAYPNAKVFCLNMPNRNVGNSPVAYNTAIANAIEEVNANNCKENVYLVDLYNSELQGATYQRYALDNLHPNAGGMDYMSEVIKYTMKEELCGKLLVSNPISEQELAGKKMSFLGDSITAGDGSGFSSRAERFSSVLCSELSAVEINMGISGTVLCTGHANRASRLADVDKIAIDSDYVFVMLGTNDFDNASAGFAELGKRGSTDTSTVYGAINELCKRLVARFADTNAKIYLVTPIPTQNSLDSTAQCANGWSLRDWSNILCDTAMEYGLNYIDLNSEAKLESADMANNLHPNTSGTAKMVAVLKTHLLENESYYVQYE